MLSLTSDSSTATGDEPEAGRTNGGAPDRVAAGRAANVSRIFTYEPASRTSSASGVPSAASNGSRAASAVQVMQRIMSSGGTPSAVSRLLAENGRLKD